MLEVQRVSHPGGTFDAEPSPDDDFDVGYLKAVNWQFQNEHAYRGRKDIEFRFVAKHFKVFDRFKGDEVTYTCKYVTEETVEMA